MRDVLIEEIEILPDGQLLVRPIDNPLDMFEYIYRAGAEVAWDLERKSLASPVPRDWSHVDWFGNILSAVQSELGVRLKITDATVWKGVPEATRSAIEDLAIAAAT